MPVARLVPIGLKRYDSLAKNRRQSITMGSFVLTPFLRTPFTDIFSQMSYTHGHKECAMLELRVVDCLEAYGLPRGHQKCRVLMDDFGECMLGRKQKARIEIMANERARQWKAGERKEHWAEDTPIDSY